MQHCDVRTDSVCGEEWSVKDVRVEGREGERERDGGTEKGR